MRIITMSVRGLFLFSLMVLSAPGFSQLTISEFQASNIATALDPHGNYLEWIEVHNNGNQYINLDGYLITDDLDSPSKHIIRGVGVGAHSYQVIWLDPDGEHDYIPMKLNMDGEEIGLFHPDGQIIDSLTFPMQYVGISYGRSPEQSSEWLFYSLPTPGLANSNNGVSQGQSALTVHYSHPGGFYQGEVLLELSTPGDTGQIRYTLDGSWPRSYSLVYTDPLLLDKTSVIRARIEHSGSLPGPVSTHTIIVNDSTTLPVVSISTDSYNYFNDYTGIYVEGLVGETGMCSTEPVNWNLDWERPVNFEYFSTGGVQEVNQLTGSKIYGGCSRTAPFKSLGIYARKKYGKNRLEHKFFESKEISSFKSLVLRNSGNDSWKTLFRDGFMQGLLEGKVDIDIQGYQPVRVYINGEYWGIQNIREKINEHYPESNYDMDSDDIDMLEKELYVQNNEVINGDGEHYKDMYEYAQVNDLSEQQHFDYVASRMDVEEFLNYYIAQIYFENFDWPKNNIKYWRPHTAEGRWRWVLYDTDFGWGLYTGTGNIIKGTITNEETWTQLIRSLMENENYKHELFQRMASMINTVFNPQRVQKVFESYKVRIDPEIGRHISRWGRPSDWTYNLQTTSVMPEFTVNRPDEIRELMMEAFDISGTFDLTLSVDLADRGLIRVAGIDMPAEMTGPYFNNIPLRISAVPKSGYRFSHWQGASTSSERTLFLNTNEAAFIQAVFEPDEKVNGIWINEISPGIQEGIIDEYGQAEDWIEIINDGDEDIDLSGWFLSDSSGDARKFMFPEGNPEITTVRARDYILVWCDNDISQGPLHTNFKLAREGETLMLTQAVGEEILLVDSLTYPEFPKELVYGRSILSKQWEFLQPTPRAANRPVPRIDLFINEYLTKGESGDWIEIYNPNSDTVDLGGLFVSDSLLDPLKHMIPRGQTETLIPPLAYKLLWADGQSELGPLHLGFKLDGRQEQIGLYQSGIGMIDSISYLKKFSETVHGRLPDGSENIQMVSPTPGLANEVRFMENIFINEFMAGNRSTYSDEFGEYDDWIELYNGNDYPLDIGGAFLSDSLGELTKHRIPSHISDSTTIPANGFLVLMTDGQEDQGGLHVNFKLSSDGEKIVLVQPDGQGIVDSLSFGELATDISVGRLVDGSTHIQMVSPTPGYANEVRFLQNVYINEFMSSNINSHSDEFGEYDDWIELYNGNDFAVDIGGAFMTDSLGDRRKYRIPSYAPDSTIIPARGYLVLWADGDEEQGILHLGFKLSSEGEEIGIVQSDGEGLIDSLCYSEVFPNQSLGILENGTGEMEIVTASPGYKNFLNPTEKLYISEIVASGNTTYADDSGVYEDWIEIYNDNDFPVDIGGLFLTDSMQFPAKYRIGTEMPDSTTIPPKGYIVLWADNQPEQGYHHLGFRLRGKGEQLVLSGYSGSEIIDSVSFPDQYSNFSYSRENCTGDWKFFPPSPGTINGCTPPTGIIINEFMASSTSLTDEFGEFDDWLEIHNSNDTEIDVGGLYLSDSLGDPTKFRIPSHSPWLTTIPAGGYFVLFADDQKEQGVNHTNFRLGREGEQIGLFHYDEETVIDSLSYTKQFKNIASGRVSHNKSWAYIPPTPGGPNQLPDFSALHINEVMGNNMTIYHDEYNEYDDWIELYNGGDEPLDIGGLFLTDSLEKRTKHRISSESPDSTTILAGDYLILWADDSDGTGVLHLDMKVAKTGEQISLYDYNGILIDSVNYPFVSPNLSWGRIVDGDSQWVRFDQPTPMHSNLKSAVEQVQGGTGEVSLYPNPVSDHAVFRVESLEPAAILIEIVDSRGSVVSLIEHHHPGSGICEYEWNAQDAQGSKLPGGIYLYLIRVGTHVYSGKFISQ